MKVIYETPSKNYIISYDEERKLFICTMSGMIEVEEYKRSFNFYLDNYPYDTTPNVLFNNTYLNSSPAQGRAWFASYVIPEFRRRLVDETRVKKFAVANPKNLFQNSVNKILYKVAKQLGFRMNVQFFDTYEQAMAWLDSE